MERGSESRAAAGSSESRGDSTAAERAVWCRLSADPRGKAKRFWWCVLSAIALVTADQALAQAPGRYVPQIQIRGNSRWVFQVEAVDVFPDKSIRVNLLVSTKSGGQEHHVSLFSKVNLVSDSLERLKPAGYPEGKWEFGGNNSDQKEIVRFVIDDPIRLTYKFPPFEQETKYVKFILYGHSGWGMPDVTFDKLPLFAK